MRGKGGSLKEFLLKTIEGMLTGMPDMVATSVAGERHSPIAQAAQTSTSAVLTRPVSQPGVSVSAECCARSHNKPWSFPSA